MTDRRTPKELASEQAQRPDVCVAIAIENLFRTIGIEGTDEVGLDQPSIQKALESQAEAIAAGDTRRLEDMLSAQAHLLQAICSKYAAMASRAEFLQQTECHMGIALRAQDFCRKTILTLMEMKRPKRLGTVIEQQNNALAQQINQTKALPKSAPDEANKLIGSIENEQDAWLDRRTTGGAGRSGAPPQVVGKVHRAQEP